jgi:chromosome segregation ATPase
MINKKIQKNNDVLTKSFFLEVMNKISSKLDEHSKILDKHTAILDEHSKKLDEHTKRHDSHDQKFDKHEANFTRIYDAITDLSIKLDKYEAKNEAEHANMIHIMNGHFDHIYNKLIIYDNEWTCLNAWIDRQTTINKTVDLEIKKIKMHLSLC